MEKDYIQTNTDMQVKSYIMKKYLEIQFLHHISSIQKLYKSKSLIWLFQTKIGVFFSMLTLDSTDIITLCVKKKSLIKLYAHFYFWIIFTLNESFV